MSLFVHTSALYAFLVRTEEDHAAVVDAFRQAAESGRALVATNYVLVETAALLQHRFGVEAVRDLAMRILPLLRVVWVREEQHRRALELLFREDRRSLSLVVCVSFVVMGTEGLSEALALDEDFERHGFRTLPARRKLRR